MAEARWLIGGPMEKEHLVLGHKNISGAKELLWVIFAYIR